MLREQLLALSPDDSCIVLTGEPPEDHDAPGLAAAARVVPHIAYDAPGSPPGDARAAARAVREAMVAEWGTTADVLHVHNALLARCAILPEALALLREQGIAVLIQVHDLAEDGRPHAWRPDTRYPEDCHYAVINSRDRRALLAAGLSPEGLHLLPNPVLPVETGAAGTVAPETARLADGRLRLLYPVRGIRRKNLGEALLLSLLVEGELLVTLPPRDPGDLERWNQWRSFVEKEGLPARFGAGEHTGLTRLMQRADCAVSTSLNEGFGFAFLEPWTAGLRVAGRRIAHAAEDLEAAGIRLPHLYAAFPVPCSGFDSAGFAERWSSALAAAWRAYGRTLSRDSARSAFSRLTDGGAVDFGALDEAAQRQVISHAAADGGLRKGIREGNPVIAALRGRLTQPEPDLVEANRQIILSRYAPRSCVQRLREVYRAAIENPVRQRIDRQVLLDQFLSPERFRLLETR